MELLLKDLKESKSFHSSQNDARKSLIVEV